MWKNKTNMWKEYKLFAIIVDSVKERERVFGRFSGTNNNSKTIYGKSSVLIYSRKGE